MHIKVLYSFHAYYSQETVKCFRNDLQSRTLLMLNSPSRNPVKKLIYRNDLQITVRYIIINEFWLFLFQTLYPF